MPKGYSNKLVAQQTLQIFENMNARSPGWLASIGLFFAYFTSLGMAGVFALVLIVGNARIYRRCSPPRRSSPNGP